MTTGTGAGPRHQHGPRCTSELRELGEDAWKRGLYREAVQRFKIAAGHGDDHAAGLLIHRMHALHPGDDRPAQWGVTHAALHSPAAVGALLGDLQAVGADAQVAAVLVRNPAVQVALNDVAEVAKLFQSLNAMLMPQTGLGYEPAVQEQIVTLARRAASEMPLRDPFMVSVLLFSLDQPGTERDVAALLARDPAAEVVLARPYGITDLMAGLEAVGGHQQLGVLAERVTRHAASMPLQDPREIASLLEDLDRAQASAQTAVLLARDPATHVSLEDPAAVARLLARLVALGHRDQASVLAQRAVVDIPLHDPNLVAVLLDNLRGPGLANHRIAVLGRSPATQVSLNEPAAVAYLLHSLRRAAADDQIDALLTRDPANYVALDTPEDVLFLLETLRAENAQQQIDAILERLPNPEHFSLLQIDQQQEIPEFGYQRDGGKAEPWGWDDLE
ncbi:hypothetical protein ACFOY4_30930 [Actinomadura syzygii]|uniref:Uncharacterized protein n=1 Tax=Actinomadura syzygii TaxID=1427538 RepID=A0A5D0TSP4_9ACTN|nr:hypothetical protein [Actinomadura syzygii]TYC08734.1 hypothetical protein FXF65_38325 [Actinomadura syzygii]